MEKVTRKTLFRFNQLYYFFFNYLNVEYILDGEFLYSFQLQAIIWIINSLIKQIIYNITQLIFIDIYFDFQADQHEYENNSTE